VHASYAGGRPSRKTRAGRIHKIVALSTAFRNKSRNAQGGTSIRARGRAAGRHDATKPRKLPCPASVGTRTDLRASSPPCGSHDGVELRLGVSFKRCSACASRHRFCAGELLVARPSSFPST
jgi:hypothetical protein